MGVKREKEENPLSSPRSGKGAYFIGEVPGQPRRKRPFVKLSYRDVRSSLSARPDGSFSLRKDRPSMEVKRRSWPFPSLVLTGVIGDPYS